MSFINDLSQYPFLMRAVLNCLFISIGFGLISPFIISKEESFLPPAVSHSSLLGASIALFFTQDPFLVFIISTIITCLVSFLIAYNINNNKLPKDLFIGIFLALTLSLGLFINEKFLSGKYNLFHFLFGNSLLISSLDIWITFSICTISIIFILVFFKTWIFICFDPQNASIYGVPKAFFEYLFIFLICLLVMASIKTTGIILVNSVALLPGFVAFQLATKTKKIFITSIIYSIITCLIGFYFSTSFNITSGVMISLTQIFFLFVILFIQKIFAFKRR